jgi:hypothetical protein
VRRLTARFDTPLALVTAFEQEMRHGGLLVRGADAAGLSLYDPVELEIHTTKPLVLPAQVVQMLGAHGVAVTFATAPLEPLLAEARTLADKPWPGGKDDKKPAAQDGGSVATRYKLASPSERIQIALHGTRDDRAMVLRDTNRLLHPYVLKNPNLQLDEVVAMAKMTAISTELLKQISERRDWVSRPEIAIALVRNPTFPGPLAVQVLRHVSVADLRQLAKDPKTRPAVAAAAKKMVINP